MNRNKWLSQVVKKQLGTVSNAVEVGIWRGDYSLQIIEALSPTNFFGVDPYLIHDEYNNVPNSSEYANQHNLDQLYERVNTKFNSWPCASLIRNKGVDAAAQFEDASLDFVYIDGDHTYDYVKGDIAAWWPKVKPGGILSGHDYIARNPRKGHIYGVIQAVDEFANLYGLTVLTTDDEFPTWWVTKK